MALEKFEVRNLKALFPNSYTSRPLLSQYIEYILNNFFQPPAEEYVSGFIGKRTTAFSDDDYYLSETTPERSFYSLDPMITSETSTGVINSVCDYMDLLGYLKLQNANINNQNKLFSAPYWSWSPAINPDMLINYIYYYWIPEGPAITHLKERTNVVMNIIGKKNYTYTYYDEEEDENKSIPFKSGMKIKIYDDANLEYNNKCYLVEGVGKSIKLIEEPENGYPNMITPNYFCMERGSVDGNPWSMNNRWFHKSLLDTFDFSNVSVGFHQAQRPIIGFVKNLQLYNYGDSYRGDVDLVYDGERRDLEDKTSIVVNGVRLVDGIKVLVTGDSTDSENNSIYVVSGLSTIGTTILQKVINGKDPYGKPVKGEGIMVTNSNLAGTYLFYNGNAWIEGQQKEYENQSPLFELYDINGKSLSDAGEYPQTTFVGNKLFDYETSSDINIPLDGYLDKRIYQETEGNYRFDNCITTSKYHYYDYDIMKEIEGYKFYRLNNEDGSYVLGTDWQLNNNISSQYICHEGKLIEEAVTVNGHTYFEMPTEFELLYQPEEAEGIKTLYVYHNGELLSEGVNYEYKDGILKLTANNSLKANDYLMTKVYKPDLTEPLEYNYFYDTPVQLTANPKNESIDYITYNEMVEHIRSIILNQLAFSGNPLGLNNYNDTAEELFRGTEIIQHSAPMSNLMLLCTKENTTIQNVIEYVKVKYKDFKNKFRNLLNQYVGNGAITDQTDYNEACQLILDGINLGKEGLFSFYNNGVSTFNNAYIPATPAYLGLDKCFKPSIIEVNNVRMLECHDGALDTLYGDYRDSILLTFEQNIYSSILGRFKVNLPTFNPLKYIPGKFRKTEYTRGEYLQLLEPYFIKWCYENNIDYTVNDGFSKDDVFTWNWSSQVDQDGEALSGHYRGIYLYYYDTIRPHTHPWEMLGFGTKPVWWDSKYGHAPYTSENIPMWTDIENGYIADGDSKGYYEELKREGLVEKYLPVDTEGNLKDPNSIGITTGIPNMYQAQQNWNFGDCAKFEYIWRLTSGFRYDLQTVLFLMKPAMWLEKNWDTENYREIFNNTSYFQTYNKLFNRKMIPSDIYLHNEYIDSKYIKHIGIQQWISDKIVGENNNITDYIGITLRQTNARLGYKCGSYYKKDSIKILSDSYGIIPDNNYQMLLHKSLTTKQFSYSAVQIIRVNGGYQVLGFDNNQNYFIYKVPEKSGKKTSYSYEGISVVHYQEYKNEYESLDYNTVFTNIQDLYTFIQGYGKYLTDIGWLFNVYDDDGVQINWDNCAHDFIKWIALKPSINAVLLLNPGYNYIGLMHTDFVDKVGKMCNGYWTVLNSDNKPIENKDLFVQRQLDNTFITSRGDAICCIRLNLVDYEHLILFDNRTDFGQIIYDSVINARLKRLKLFGIRAKYWTGSLFAPGYLIQGNGAISNLDKLAGDFKYFYDVDNVRVQGKFAEQAKKLIGYKDYQYMENLLVDDRSMFDFYKGYLKEKGTPLSFNKLSKSKYIMNTDEPLELYENWLFKVGEFGSVEENTVLEFMFNTDDIQQNPQVVNFTTELNPVNPDNDYILYGYNDERWLKHRSNRLNNRFTYTDNYWYYPTAGWLQKGEADHTYFTPDDMDIGFANEEIAIGDTVWVVKEDTRDWSYKKYLGNYPDSEWQDLRFETINDMLLGKNANISDGQIIAVGKENISNYIGVQKYDSRYFDTNTMIYDPKDLLNSFETVKDRKVWMIFKYDQANDVFVLDRIENKRVNTKEIKTAWLVDDYTDATLCQMNVYDPLKGVFPNDVLDEIHYIIGTDPVDYDTSINGWGDEYLGRLWWDIDKVRYYDYEQGSLQYRRDNWGKMIDGSEIVINEWTKSQQLPDNISQYIVKEVYNPKTDTNETWYYYWVKNPTTVPEQIFRTKSAFLIAQTMGKPDDLDITYMSPIGLSSNYKDYVSSMMIKNFDIVMGSTDCVIQLNFVVDDKIDNHKEWLMIRENSIDDIDERLWNKMIYSLIGEDSAGNIIPDPELSEAEKYGILIRPRQSMFKNVYEARRNLRYILNAIFMSRDLDVATDLTVTNFDDIFMAIDKEDEADYEVETRKDLSYISDSTLYGKTFLVKSDETFYNRWTVYEYTKKNGYVMIDFQKYNVQDFWSYANIFVDGYSENTYVVKSFDSEEDFLEVWNTLSLTPGSVITYKNGDGNTIWKLYNQGGTFSTVGIENGTIQFNSRFYDYLEGTDTSGDTYEYIDDEVKIVLPMILSYF